MLETKIEQLTKQIETLNSNFESFFNSVNNQLEVKEVKEVKEVEDVKEVKDVKEKAKPKCLTRQDVRDLCMAKVRADRRNSAKIKAILSGFDAGIVEDVKEEGLQEVAKLIGAL